MSALTADDRRDTFRVPKHRKHVPEARARVRKVLADWGLDSLADDVGLAATELVANAVRHCRMTWAQIEVAVSVQGFALVLEVSDPDGDKLPALGVAGPEQEGGRGLILIAELSECWGVSSRTYGKCVWASFVIPKKDHSCSC